MGMNQMSRARLGRMRARLLHEVEPLRRHLQGTLSEAQLNDALGEAGVQPGATVMLHVSMNDLARVAPGVDGLALIRLLKQRLTPDGTLLMLTSPFIGWQADYVATRPAAFDVRRTPSRMGLVTELFRRMPDTRRSLHPTHSVAGWGLHAAEILESHHLGETFAESSPFCRMREQGGIVVGIGTDTRNGFTILHAAEYLHPEAREYAFSSDRAVLPIKSGDETIEYAFRSLRRDLNRRHRKIESELRATRTLIYARKAGLLIASAATDEFIERTLQIITAGSFYSSGPLASR
jgi:aminoglycoside N3'-acetyltransferase